MDEISGIFDINVIYVELLISMRIAESLGHVSRGKNHNFLAIFLENK